MTEPAIVRWPAHPEFQVNAPGEKVPAPELPTSFLVFDVETVRDPMFPPEFKDDGTEKFPNAAQMEVVSVCGLLLGPRGEFVRPVVFGRGGAEEARVWDFARLVGQVSMVNLVSWNGRGFDGPVLTARLMRHGWASPFYDHSYRKRYDQYGTGLHIDLCDQLCDFGAGTRAGLDHYARLVGLPGKAFGDGGGVAELHARGERDAIDYYCLTDVLQTGFLLGRFLLTRGDVTREVYREVATRNLSLCRDVFGNAPVDEDRLLLRSRSRS